MKSDLNSGRRNFLKASGAFAAMTLTVGANVGNPGRRLRVAQVGVGNRGQVNLKNLIRLEEVEMVAICDVDKTYLASAAELCPDARHFMDYRVMLEEFSRRIDAVLISTPDHMHAPIAIAAMQAGKHVYCEKPLAHNIFENRQLAELAERTGVVTQLGIQNSAGIGNRMTTEYIQSGLIGKVREVHLWSNKEWGLDAIPSLEQPDAVPPQLHWNLWLGVSGKRPYKAEIYHPKNWRKLLEFGTGTLGDMGVHIFDTPYRMLELTAPKWVKATCRDSNGFSHPSKTKVEYGFPSTRFTTSELKWVWYDGLNAPPKDIPGFVIPEDRELPEQGYLMIGEKGAIMTPHKSGPQTFPRELIRSVPRPEIEPRDHYLEWVNACLGAGRTNSPFEYGGPLCEALQLGVIACRYPDRKLKWDPNEMKVTNVDAANVYITRDYRDF